jgi:hypothetical protein
VKVCCLVFSLWLCLDLIVIADLPWQKEKHNEIVIMMIHVLTIKQILRSNRDLIHRRLSSIYVGYLECGHAPCLLVVVHPEICDRYAPSIPTTTLMHISAVFCRLSVIFSIFCNNSHKNVFFYWAFWGSIVLKSGAVLLLGCCKFCKLLNNAL